MKETTLRLLAYCKEFFIRGERELEQNTNMGRMQAVLKFHDSVEYCVRAIIEEHKVNHDRNLDLIPLMKCIEKSITDKTLPLFSQIDFLNTTRGKIKHHASVPSPEDTQRCRLHTKEFLGQVSKSYLDIDFASINRLVLIENLRVRRLLDEAEKKRREGDYLGALARTKVAFKNAQPSIQTFLFKKSFSKDLDSSLRRVPRGMGDLIRPIAEIANRVGELEQAIALLMMGVDVLKLRRFQEITPIVNTFGSGKREISWDTSIVPDDEMTLEAMEYVIDMILIWQSMGVVGHRPDPFKPTKWRRMVREEKWEDLD
jgi:hypothetical protein